MAAWTAHAVFVRELGRDVAEPVSVGVDGACALMIASGWRQVRARTIALYNSDGERLHTTYERMDRELAAVREACPEARYTGEADGAANHWAWPERHTTWQTIDFWHASEFVNGAATAMTAGSSTRAEALVQEACYRLKHVRGVVEALASEFAAASLREGVRRKVDREALEQALSYFTNNAEKMRYHLYLEMGLPLGSGVTEAACKTVVKVTD